jgi:hypothetical protein
VSINIVRGYRLPPGCSSGMDYAGFGRFGTLILPEDSGRFATEHADTTGRVTDPLTKAAEGARKVVAVLAPTPRDPTNIVMVPVGEKTPPPAPKGAKGAGHFVLVGLAGYLLYRMLK